jgi:hypothetical protein
MMNEQTFDPATPAPDKERPFLPRINDGGILGRLGEHQEPLITPAEYSIA